MGFESGSDADDDDMTVDRLNRAASLSSRAGSVRSSRSDNGGTLERGIYDNKPLP
jgi:hypothetical protein